MSNDCPLVNIGWLLVCVRRICCLCSIFYEKQ